MELWRKYTSITELTFVRDEDLKEKLLRIGSMDYEPLPAVKQYTLDAKLKDLMDLPDHNAQKKAQPGSSTDLENKLDTIK